MIPQSQLRYSSKPFLTITQCFTSYNHRCIIVERLERLATEIYTCLYQFGLHHPVNSSWNWCDCKNARRLVKYETRRIRKTNLRLFLQGVPEVFSNFKLGANDIGTGILFDRTRKTPPGWFRLDTSTKSDSDNDEIAFVWIKKQEKKSLGNHRNAVEWLTQLECCDGWLVTFQKREAGQERQRWSPLC